MSTIAEKIIAYNHNLKFDIGLPRGIRVMNPFRENPEALEVSTAFYRKFYNDNNPRRLILGINPGRFGAGVTGVPFTDTKRLYDMCGLQIRNTSTHEPSSVFIYEMIDAFGGVKNFYGDYYINSVCPLGFVKVNSKNREINYNYYDDRQLSEIITPFAVESIKAHISMGCHTDIGFCLGTGKNYDFLSRLNEQYMFFDKIIPLEHPRYIMQYKSTRIGEYISKYLETLKVSPK